MPSSQQWKTLEGFRMTWTKAVAANCTSSRCFPHYHTLKQKKILFWLNLNPQVHVFLMFRVTKWERTQKAPLPQTKVPWGPGEGAWATVCLWADGSCLFHGTPFFLKEWQPYKLRLFRFEYLADKWAYPLEKNNWVLVPVITFRLSSKNENFGKLESATMSLTYLNTFLMRSVVKLKNATF